MKITVNMKVGSNHHKQLVSRMEHSSARGIKPTWNYEGVDMNIVDAYRCGTTNYIGVVLEGIGIKG